MTHPTTEQKVARLKLVADGLRRIQEFESARYLDEYAATLKAAQGGVTDHTLREMCRAYETTAHGFADFTPNERGLQAMRAALEAALSAPEPAAQGEAVAWMVPHIVSFRDAVRTSCPPEMQAVIEGTVAWHPELIGDSHPVTDRDGVTHKPRPLVYGDTAPPAQPAEVEATLRRILERGKHRTDGDLVTLLDRVEHMTRGDQDLIAMQRTENRLLDEKAAQPAERVPAGWVLVPAEAGDTDAFMVLHEYQQPGRTRKDAYRIAIRKLSERARAHLTASPAPSEGWKGVEEWLGPPIPKWESDAMRAVGAPGWDEDDDAQQAEGGKGVDRG